ncbi:MAG: hypothetical protein M1830_010300 [Pleopsidium flavum]|nr:MAG: hypothetical protein M1830_010300 [Pleopsidium flavum]
MHVLSVASVFLATALLSSATPTGTSNNLVPRACTTLFPTFIDHIDEQNPNTATVDSTFEVALDDNAGTLFHRDVLVRFDNIPAGSYGCQLDAFFPAGATITSTGATQVNVFSLDRLAEPTDTFATAPNNVNLFGTITFSSSATDSRTAVINSGVCAPSLSFRFTLASPTAIGDVNFAEILNTQGLRITFNC